MGDSVGVYRQGLVALYWCFWQLSDGATLGDPAIVQLAEQAAAPGSTGEMLRPDAADALDALFEPSAALPSSPEATPA